MNHNLAIVIPAYKPDFFKETLRSIQAQSDQRFSLYIFDDASPANLESIVQQFAFEFPVTFKRFEKNMGSESLVKQWERCIDQTENEEWIWLFSDDDIMEPDCVKSYYQAKVKNPGYAAYRFHTKKISAEGDVIRENRFPATFDGADFLNLKLSYEQESYVVEYIFSREGYEFIGGFPDLPLAWASDDLFCLKLADYGRICTIEGGNICWRYSDLNVSGKSHRGSARQKMEASYQFVNWILDHQNIRDKLNPRDLPISWYVRQLRTMRNQLTMMDELKAVQKLAVRDKRVWKHFFKMKKNRSKIIGWLKRFSS
ncbi:glycosyltransferase family 2 protein [Rhodohalobacter sp. 614A]|uniref:glycosyltransferase family 2 protein n=1 Tax=Rhodohalobacter sp. 614A TaxID=2908649 RepID=UPI001F2BC19D|nr:glycosyltransferase family A protein [Rhodohalobacter sp. 614A]